MPVAPFRASANGPGALHLAARAVVFAQLLVETPRTVFALMPDQPLQGEFDRVLAVPRRPLRQGLPPAVAAPRQAAAGVVAHRETRVPARFGRRRHRFQFQLRHSYLGRGNNDLRMSDLGSIQDNVVPERLVGGGLQRFLFLRGRHLDDQFLERVRVVRLGPNRPRSG